MLARTLAQGSILFAAALALSACQSAGIDDLAPGAAITGPLPLQDAAVPVPSAAPRTTAETAAPVEATAPAPAAAPRQTVSSAPKNTGDFPKIGNVPVGETAQLGAGGAAALRSGLSAARASQDASGDAPESYAEKLRLLRLLKAKHAAETLAEIEARKPQ